MTASELTIVKFLVGILKVLLVGELFHISWIDMQKRIIPNKNLLAVALMLAVVLFCEDNAFSWQQGTIQLLVCFGVGSAVSIVGSMISGKCVLGMGDVKLLSLFAFALPLFSLINFLCLVGLGSCLWALVYTVRKERSFPLAPVLCVSFCGVYFGVFSG